MSISLKLDKHLNNFGYLLESYLLFPMVPRNVGSIMSVTEHEHFTEMLTINLQVIGKDLLLKLKWLHSYMR